MSDDPNAAEPALPPAGIELEVDLAAFLPDGATIEPDEAARPEPAPDPAEPGHAPVDSEPTPPVPAAEAAPAPPVDLAVLAGIEADLAAVDLALEAIDAGDPARSPLLAELLDASRAD